MYIYIQYIYFLDISLGVPIAWCPFLFECFWGWRVFFNLLNVLFSSVFRAKTRLCHVAMRWLSPDSVDHQEAHEGAKMLENNIQYGT